MLDGDRVAIVLLSAIGDVVHAFPLVSSLAAAAPHARIEWIVQPALGRLAARHPAVRRTWLLERDRGWRGFRDFRRAVRAERFDLAIDLQVYGKASLATLILDARRKLGFDRPRAREGNWLATSERIPRRPAGHVREQYMEFADWLGVPRRYAWPLPLSTAERAERDAFPASPRDERTDDLDRLVVRLSAAALAIGCDTGPYHLAVALDVPSIGLFGTTDPARHGPGRRFADLVVDAWHDPGEAWHPPRATRRTGRMDRIAVDRVAEKAELARRRYRRAVDGPPDEPAPSPV